MSHSPHPHRWNSVREQLPTWTHYHPQKPAQLSAAPISTTATTFTQLLMADSQGIPAPKQLSNLPTFFPTPLPLTYPHHHLPGCLQVFWLVCFYPNRSHSSQTILLKCRSDHHYEVLMLWLPKGPCILSMPSQRPSEPVVSLSLQFQVRWLHHPSKPTLLNFSQLLKLHYALSHLKDCLEHYSHSSTLFKSPHSAGLNWNAIETSSKKWQHWT